MKSKKLNNYVATCKALLNSFYYLCDFRVPLTITQLRVTCVTLVNTWGLKIWDLEPLRSVRKKNFWRITVMCIATI